MVEQITMNVDNTLELDYLVEQVSDDVINIASKPNNDSSSIEYISTRTGIFNPQNPGTYQLEIKGQTIEIEVTKIPDSGDLHSRWDFSDKTSADTIENEVSDESDLVTGSGSPSIVTDGKNGLNVVKYESSNSDQHDTTFNSSITEPLQIFWTFKWDELPNWNNRVSLSDDASDHRFFTRNSDWRIEADGDSQTADDSADKDWHVGSLYWGDSSVELRIDKTSLLTSSNTGKTWSGLTVGSRADDQNYLSQKVGEILVYPQDKRSSEEVKEDYLADKWGITV
jgi:hypothetical protein